MSQAEDPREGRADTAFRHLDQGLCVWSPGGRIVYCNPAFALSLGLPQAALNGLNARELLERARRQGALISDETQPDAAAIADRAARLGGTLLICADGRALSVNDSPMPDGGAISVLVDVTEARRNLTALAQARDKAAAADQSKSRFLRAANHDLRQPLASLKILVYSCLAAENEEDRKQALHAMDVSVSIMEDLLGALLNIGQLDAGKIEPSIATFQISAILSRLEVQFAHQAREKGLKLRIIPSKLAVVSDRVLLERILANLVSNAIRYTEVGRVLVGCRRHGRMLRVIVADTGIGIAPEYHEAIFEEFYRVSDTQSHAKHSLGLGLNIARRLSDILGHELGIASQVGKGTVFHIDVPIGNVWHSGTGEPEISERIGGEFAGLCGLVLEDDKILREAFTTLLQRWGMTVVTIDDFDNVAKAVSELDCQPDIILTDYRLRGRIQGTDLVGAINDILEKPCPALVMTAETAPEVISSIKAQGFPLLIKPVSPPALRILMHNLLFEPDLVTEF
ncbi:MAG: PAS-domain containing protein [Rhizobiales bacterium]|nr:PAS-domain containing protein [Hyphomicrobiales bacterium]